MTRPAHALLPCLLIATATACAPATRDPATAASYAPTAATSYPAMAPIAQYQIASREDEIALARSAAPPSVTNDAEVLVLGEHGYETAAAGKNGFVCFVERSWANTLDDAEFWNPKVRSPNCFNAPAARSVLPQYLKVTEWVLSGVSRDEMIARTKAALASHSIPAPEPGSMCFMMSRQGYLNDAGGHWHPHVMIFAPRTAASAWGANLPASPIFAHEGTDLDPTTIFMIPVPKWSDGSPEPEHHEK